MGTRINVLFEHELADFRNRETVLERLAATAPVALALRDYWREADLASPRDQLTAWRANPVSKLEENLHRYTGPGSLFLTLTDKAAHIRTGGRWRGFLTIEPLRRVHLAAFRQIAGAFGYESMAMYPDSCEVDDVFWASKSYRDCVQLMERIWGPPRRSVEHVDPVIDTESPAAFRVWFLEES